MAKKTILVPIDFGDATSAALSQAKELARRLDAEVKLLHVVGLPVDASPGYGLSVTPELEQALMDAAQQGLDRVATEGGGLARELTVGDPAREILRVTADERPALVVIGTHGRRGVARLFLGSVAERVVRESVVPVVTVRADALVLSNLQSVERTILVPVELDESHRALEMALQLSGPLEAAVVLLHVYKPPVFGYPDVPAELGVRVWEEVAAGAKSGLEALAKSAGGIRAILREGDPVTCIEETIDALRPVLVVMGTRGRRGLSRWLLGSVTEEVLRVSPSPVLTTREPEASE